MTEKITINDVTPLLNDISISVRDLTKKVSEIKQYIKDERISTAKGLNILEVKNQMFLNYLGNIIYLVLQKCRGKQVGRDSAIERLVEIRTILERISPVENKLKYQIDKFIKIAAMGGHNFDDLTFRANPMNLLGISDKVGTDSDKSDDPGEGCSKQLDDGVKNSKDNLKPGIYVPPKLVPMHYDEAEKAASKQEKYMEKARWRALNSSVMQELGDEYLDTPTEVSQTNIYKYKQSKFAKEKQEYEESYFTRLTVLKQERHKRRSDLSGNNLDGIAKFEDVSVLDEQPGPSFVKKRKNNR